MCVCACYMNVLLKKPAEEELWWLNPAVLVSFTIAHFRAAPTRNFHPIFIHFTPHARTEIRQNFAKYRQKYWGIL